MKSSNLAEPHNHINDKSTTAKETGNRNCNDLKRSISYIESYTQVKYVHMRVWFVTTEMVSSEARDLYQEYSTSIRSG